MRRIFLTKIIFLFSIYLFAQTKIRYNDEYRNSINGMIYPGILFTSYAPRYIGLVNLGYERKFKKDFTLGFTGSWNWVQEGEYTSAKVYSIAPELKYYFPKKKNKFPVNWIGASISFAYSVSSDFISRYYYGFGILAGTKIFFSKKHKWYLCLGGSLSVNKEIWVNTFEWYKGNTFPVLLPKLIFNLGYRF